MVTFWKRETEESSDRCEAGASLPLVSVRITCAAWPGQEGGVGQTHLYGEGVA